MIHYHGTPISPRRELLTLAGKNFCVSFAHPEDVLCCHQIGQSVMLDNGAFSMWTKGKPVDWNRYYEWCETWLDYNTTWAVIPDVIGGSVKENNVLIDQWPHGQGMPVWHLHEPIDRIFYLLDTDHPSICFGSSAEYKTVGSDKWNHRMAEVFNCLSRSGPIPWIHMLRGMSLSGSHYPFSSVDSTDVARNHNRKQNTALSMANRWDSLQCPAHWNELPLQQELIK